MSLPEAITELHKAARIESRNPDAKLEKLLSTTVEYLYSIKEDSFAVELQRAADACKVVSKHRFIR